MRQRKPEATPLPSYVQALLRTVALDPAQLQYICDRQFVNPALRAPRSGRGVDRRSMADILQSSRSRIFVRFAHFIQGQRHFASGFLFSLLSCPFSFILLDTLILRNGIISRLICKHCFITYLGRCLSTESFLWPFIGIKVHVFLYGVPK